MLETPKDQITDKVKMFDMTTETMGNQQRSLDQRLCWLGGILDGEGCVNLSYHSKGKATGITPLIQITNTDKFLVDEVTSILESLNVAFYVGRTQLKNTKNKLRYDVRIQGLKRVLRVIDYLIGVSFSKKHRLLLLKEFCIQRLDKKCSSIDKDDLWYANQLKQFNRKGTDSKPLTDYTPNTSDYSREDIVGTVLRDTELTRNALALG